jgi:ABC-type transport system involved in multi-copper enzyme maturation permease subunit
MDFGGDSDVTTRNATISLAVMLVYIAVFALIAFRIFNRRDVTTS